MPWPALLTRMETGPCCEAISATTSRAASWSVTSSARTVSDTPAASAAARSSPSRAVSRIVATTSTPAEARATAACIPMPDEQPVTNAVSAMVAT